VLFSYAGTKQSTPFRRLSRALCWQAASVKKFELDILFKLLSHSGLEALYEILKESEPIMESSGAGYFLFIRDSRLPSERIVLSEPLIAGKLGDLDVGFLAFIESSELMFECYTYENKFQSNHREQEFVQSAT
jgi:hypothetical protein